MEVAFEVEHPGHGARAGMDGVIVMTGIPMDAQVDVAALDAAVGKVRAGLPSWVGLPVEEKAGLVHRLRRRFGDEVPGMVEAWRLAQGLESDSFWIGDVWAGESGVPILVRGWESTLTRLARGDRLVAPKAVGRDALGQVTVDVFPASRADQLLYGGYSGRVRLEPGTTAAEVATCGAALASGEFPDAGVALLLAAGNFDCLPGSDALGLLLGHGCTVVMKLNPVNAYLRPSLERLFVEFIDAGWLAIVEGGPEVGAYLAHHQDVDRVHLTGSAATYNALVWGTGPDAERRRASGQRLLDKPFTAELGGVNPLIVAPGRWTRHDLRRQADRIAYGRLCNSGHFCAATQILVLPDGWDQADQLLDDLRELLRTLEPRAPYYPGTDARVARALADQDHVEALSPDGRRFLVTGLDPGRECSLFRDEVFADVLGVVRLPAPDVESYLTRAVGFANEALAGSLGATLLVDPDTEAHHRPAVTNAVAGLCYGFVGINEHAGFTAAAPQLLWGAYPGNTPEDIGSGVGFTFNTLMLPRPEQSVLRAAFRTPIKSLFTATHKTRGPVFKAYMDWAASGDNPRKLPHIVLPALRG
jgi:acyl-CoA reductase-like NAD-dependent aldehyde dehydrogenase